MTETATAPAEAKAKRKHPRFNHIAISVDPSLLSTDGRAELLKFYGDVFGWIELPTMTEDDRRLVLSAYTYDQFVYLHADKKPMTAPPGDHWGMGVDTVDEFTELYDKCVAFQQDDPRLEIIKPHVDDYGVLKLHGFYVRFLLPIMIEIQHFEWVPGGEYSEPAAG
jgi:hypothetical protein